MIPQIEHGSTQIPAMQIESVRAKEPITTYLLGKRPSKNSSDLDADELRKRVKTED